jgi:sensor histidine kinase YesM
MNFSRKGCRNKPEQGGISLKMVWKKLARTGLPMLLALLVILGFIYQARLSEAQTPSAKSGVLDLGSWNGKKTLEMTGEWEFYWGSLLTGEEIREGSYSPMHVDAPGYWNDYKINDISLSGKGKATYRIRVRGAEAGTRYGVRIQDMGSVYRLYIDYSLVAQNGSFGDTESAPASAYRPQLAAFTPTKDSFDLILQVVNDTYAMGGMWEPIIFGTYKEVSVFDKMISNADAALTASLIITCLFFLIFFAAQRGEKDMLIFSGTGFLVLLRFLTDGDMTFSAFFPQITIACINRIQFLTLPWIQFMLMYFVYYAYGSLVRRWQVITLLACSVSSSLFILLFPFDTVISAYMVINITLLLVIAVITVQLTRAAWRGCEGASLLLFAVLLIMLLIFYELFLSDRSTGYYLLSNLHFEYIVFVFAQVAVVAMRYRRAQSLEIAHLKGQIRPHFIHNALTSIISISRTEPDRARELLVDFSSYLRSFYDFERDELVSFTQELELVSAYVALEQARFGEKLRVEYHIETEDFLLPSLVLQPLVENAFTHGLSEKDNGGTVTVYTRRMKNSRVRVGVRDDGVGFSEKTATTRRGVGIENINRRLFRLYRTSLVYLIPEDGGCEVYFEIYYKEAAEHESLAD